MPDNSFDQSLPAGPAALSGILDHAGRLAQAGDYRQAIDVATAANRTLRAPELERRIVRWRADAFPAQPGTPAPRRHFADPFPGLHGLPEIGLAALTVDILGGALLNHGALLVRDVTTREEAQNLQAGIDRALHARDLHRNGGPAEEIGSWYAETPLNTPTGTARGWGGALWLADSPHMLFDVLDLYEKRGITGVIAGYLKEPLMLSIGKSTLRRIEPGGLPHDWHQDGAFLGEDVRTVNVWLALSDCGVDAPGLDLVGDRLPGVVETGTQGAAFHWSVGAAVVEALQRQGRPVVSPVFRPGDALLFDQLMLHRTAVRPGMSKVRYAIESWFFTPSTFPMDQGPLLV